MLTVMCALARRFPVAERLIARALAPAHPPARPYPVRALLAAPHRGADLIIRGTGGVYAVTHRVSLVGTSVVILATVLDGDGARFEPSPARDLPACLPGVAWAARCVGRWSIVYRVDGDPIDVEPFPVSFPG